MGKDKSGRGTKRSSPSKVARRSRSEARRKAALAKSKRARPGPEEGTL